MPGLFTKRADGDYGTVVRRMNYIACRGEYGVPPGGGGVLDVREGREVARSDFLK